MAEIEGLILTPEGWVQGALSFGENVLGVDGSPFEGVLDTGDSGTYIVPGFVDLHVHGGFGFDMMESGAAVAGAAAFHARHGTTALLATSVTAPFDDIARFLDFVAPLCDYEAGRARILGAHLEGPFVNPDKLGAQPPFAAEARLDLVQDWVERAPVRVMTLAPEMDPDGAVAEFLQARKVRVQMGHSLCDYACACSGLERGFGVTHLFNAMSGVSHRENGLAGAALAFADYAEIIPDLIHVEAGAILAARRAIPNLYGVSDSTAGAGMEDGAFRLGAHEAFKAGNRITLADGTLAGSVLTMDEALRNFVSIGLPLDEAARRLSTIPADWLGERQIGRIADGACADFVVLDGDLQIKAVYIGGEMVG